MPTLYVLAGPNGSGKTTFYNTAALSGLIDPSLPFVNVDLIAKNEAGGYSSAGFAIAEELMRERIGELLNTAQDFMIESNLARQSDYNWLQAVKQKGYELVLFFLGTDDLNVNLERVEKRVREGGHDVPPNIIEQRYRMGISYLRTGLRLFNRAELIDNTGAQPSSCAVVQNGQLMSKEAAAPEWVNNALYILERLADSKRHK